MPPGITSRVDAEHRFAMTQADAEWLRRIIQQSAARLVANRDAVPLLMQPPRLIEAWWFHCNYERLNTSLTGLTPNELATGSNKDHDQNRHYLRVRG